MDEPANHTPDGRHRRAPERRGCDLGSQAERLIKADPSQDWIVIGIYSVARCFTRNHTCTWTCHDKPSLSGRFQSAPVVKELSIIISGRRAEAIRGRESRGFATEKQVKSKIVWKAESGRSLQNARHPYYPKLNEAGLDRSSVLALRTGGGLLALGENVVLE